MPILLCIFLEEEPGPCPKAALFFRDCSSLVSASPPFPVEQLPFRAWKAMEAETPSLKTRNGGHRKSCVPQALQGPAQFQHEEMQELVT